MPEQDWNKIGKELFEHIQKEEGRKFDDGKPRMCEMIQDFGIALEEVAKVWAFGANKYEKGNWRHLDNAFNRYSNALVRHLVAEQQARNDLESGLYHAAHVAWNALARLHFLILQAKEEEVKRG